MDEMSDCKNCKTWEERMYWKHFNSIHFYQILSNHFHDHLVLPEKFALHMGPQFPNKVSLIDPSGNMWDVELQKTNSLQLGGESWKDFVKTNGLKENYLLMFKYNRNSSFDVLIFNQETLCEEEASYFVKKCKHSNLQNENQTKNVREGSSIEIIEADKEDDTILCMSKRSRKDVEAEVNCLGGEKNTENGWNQTSNEATNGRDESRRMEDISIVTSRNRLGKNGPTQESNQISPSDMNLSKNGRCSTAKNRSRKLMNQSRTQGNNPSEYANILEMNLMLGRDNNSLRNGEDSLEMNHSQKLKSQSRTEPSENGGAEIPSPFSSRALMMLEHGEVPFVGDHSNQTKRKRGRPKKQKVPKCGRKQVPKRANGTRYTEMYISNRREVTEVEKKDALLRAKQKQTENSFISVMRPTCVYRRFYLSIPHEWMSRNLVLKHQEIILRMGDKTWLTMFYYHNNRRTGGLSPGWKQFVLDNALEEFDVLLFKLNDNKKDCAMIVLDVEIYRVVQEIIPPILVS